MCPLHQFRFEVGHESSDRQPEIVADHEQALQSHAVTLPQSGQQFAPISVGLAVQPLLELIDDQQQFLARWQILSRTYADQVFRETASRRAWKELLSNAVVQVGFGIIGRGLEVHDSYVRRQTRQ